MRFSKHILKTLFIFACAGIAIYFLSGALRAYHYRQIADAFSAIPRTTVLLALAATIISYFVTTGYDILAFRALKLNVPWRKIFPVSFICYAFSNNAGHPLLTGAVRFRMFSGLGVDGRQIAYIIALGLFTFWLGLLLLAGGVLAFFPPAVIPGFSEAGERALGAGLLAVVAIYVAWTRTGKTFRWKSLQVTPIAFTLVPAQLAISLADWTMTAVVLYICLPAGSVPGFGGFLCLFILAQVTALISGVPGGLGVFESALLFLLGPAARTPELLGALVLFRVIYYLVPLFVAGLELLRRWAYAKQRWTAPFLPYLIQAILIASGMILLVSGATPAARGRLHLLEVLPLPVVESSHFLGSVTGMLLLILANAIRKKLDLGYYLTIALLCLGIVTSLLKGLDFEEATLLTILLIMFLPLRNAFFRKSTVTQVSPASWPLWIGMALYIGIGFFSFHHVQYNDAIWWKFALHGEASRFLRGAIAIVTLGASFLVFRGLRPNRSGTAPALNDIPAGILDKIVNGSTDTNAFLAFTGDKKFKIHAQGNAFLMYGIQGRHWISMGGPFGGTSAEKRELLADFQQQAYIEDGVPVYYQVNEESSKLLLDSGFDFFKLGEEAHVATETFSLAGGSRAKMRLLCGHMEKAGVRFRVAPPEEFDALEPRLRQISHVWLSRIHGAEKGFSIGKFSSDYLRRFPMAIAYKEDQIFAFANLWAPLCKEELSFDLMRHAESAPEGIMEYCILQIVLWAKANGWRSVNLGMAPLSGMHHTAYNPFWNEFANLIYSHGERFYHFQGLRKFKEKFNPVWSPRYLICPGGMEVPLALSDILSLISKGGSDAR